MKERSFYFLFIIIAVTGCVILPNYDKEWSLPEINGYLIDSASGLPVNRAMVTAVSGDTVFTDSNGYFHFNAKKEYVKDRLIAMDPPSPYLSLLFEKSGYEFKHIEIKYIVIDYSREKPDTLNLNKIKLKKNIP
jgi:hypothetical protein